MRIALPRALPSLEGRRGFAVRCFYLLLALVTTATVAASILLNGLDYFRNMPNAAAFGFMTRTNDQEQLAAGTIWPSAQARGLREHDRIVGLNDRQFGPAATEYDFGAAMGRVGDRIALTVERGGKRHRIVLDRQSSGWTPTVPWLNAPIWFYAGYYFLVQNLAAPFFLAASLLLFLRRSRDAEAMCFAIGFLLTCFNNNYSWWMGPYFGIPDIVRNEISYLGWLICMVAIAAFPHGRFDNRLSRISLLATLAIVLVIEPILLFGGWPFLVSDIVARVALALAVASVFVRWRSTRDIATRQQIKWTIAGFCTFGLAVLIAWPPLFELLGPPWGNVLLILIFLIGQLAVPLGLLVSLLRYRLYDADTAISRSAVFAVLTLGLLGVFAGSEKIIEALGEQYFGGSIGALAGGIAAAVAAVVIVPMHGRVERWADRRFRGNLLKLRNGLPELVGDMRETADAAELGEAACARVAKGVRAQRVAVVVGDTLAAAQGLTADQFADWHRGWQPAEGPGIVAESADPLLPVRVPLEADGCGRTGWLLLGPRPDGSLYNKDEREVLAAIADPVARALHIVCKREARDAAVQGRLSEMEGRFSALEAAIRQRRKRSAQPAV